MKNIKNEVIYTSRPSLSDSTFSAIKSVLQSRIFTNGPKLKEFEEKFAKFCKTNNATAVSNGTVAIELALRALGIKSGDEIIVPSFTTMPTVEPILHLNAIPVFVDINDSYTLDSRKIEREVTKKTKAILVVHLYGQSANLSEIKKICKKHKLFLIEDCAQAHDSYFEGKHLGTIGNIGCFSFYPTKNLSVLGEGGMIVTNKKSLADKIRLLRSHGEKGKYNHIVLGGNYRLSEIHCAIGIEQLRFLQKFTERRRKIAELYNSLFENTEIITPKEEKYAKHCYHLYVIRVDSKKRDKIIKELEKYNIFLGIHYPTPIHKQPIIRKLFKSKFKVKNKLPLTEKFSKEIISLPIYPTLSDSQVRTIAKKIKDCL